MQHESIDTISAPCPLCGEGAGSRTVQKIHHLNPFNPGSSPACDIRVVRCRRCGLLRLDPRPDDKALMETQKASLGDAAAAVGSFEAGNTNPDYPLMMAEELKAAGFEREGGRLLDVGCGSGDLVVKVGDILGAMVSGLEMGEASIQRAKRRFPEHHWTCGMIEPGVYPDETYDAISLVHVLEHLPDPVGLLRVLAAWLRPGGLLFVEVPNGEFYQSLFYTVMLESPKPILARWLRLRGRRVPFTSRGFYPYHLTLFSSRALERTVAAAGLEVVKSTMSTCRLHYWLRANREEGQWLRWCVNRIKLALANIGLGDNLLLVARKPEATASSPLRE